MTPQAVIVLDVPFVVSMFVIPWRFPFVRLARWAQ